LLRPDGGLLVYSVCTLTAEETEHVDRALSVRHPELTPMPPPGPPWEPVGRGARLLPQTTGSDGMYVLRLGTGRR
jgi:16S rRNA (cytosine967-C5)-methyltransferase